MSKMSIDAPKFICLSVRVDHPAARALNCPTFPSRGTLFHEIVDHPLRAARTTLAAFLITLRREDA